MPWGMRGLGIDGAMTTYFFYIVETLKPICYSEYGSKCCLVMRCIGKLQRELELGNSLEAEETLQEMYKHLQESTPNDFYFPSLEAKQILNSVERTYTTNSPWNSKIGTILLTQRCSENLFIRSLNVCGVLALNMCSLDISVAAFEQSVSHIDGCDEDTLNVANLGVAYNNSGCVNICKGCFQNAKENLDTALSKFIQLKNSTNGHVFQENIVTVLNNLRLVHQAQRDHIADQQVRSELIPMLRQVPLPPRVTAIVEFNEACTSFENRNLRKALKEFEMLKSFCELELNQMEELSKCISLKICLVNLSLGNSSKASSIIDTETLALPELIEFFDVKANVPLDLWITAAESLVDICVQQGNQDLACKFSVHLAQLCRGRCGASHPFVARILLKQGLVFSNMGKAEQSRQCLTDALEIFTRRFGAVHPDVLKCNVSLARLESREGFQDKSLLHCQRVLENVEKICQVSLMDQLKETFMAKFDRRKMSIPETVPEEDLKLESLTSEFGVEIASVLFQYQPSDLGDSTVSLSEIHNCVSFSTSTAYLEEICAKLSFNFLKAGLCLFNLGMAAQSTVFLLLSCTYTNMFHNYLDCSDAILVQAIFLLCHLKATKVQSVPKEERLRNEFKVLKNYIEGRGKQQEGTERKALFFREDVNLKVSLSLFLRSFVEMEMFDMIDVIHGLFSKLQDNHSQGITHIVLVEELKFAFFSSTIGCLGRFVVHDMIFSTPIGTIYKTQIPHRLRTPAACPNLKGQTSLHNDELISQEIEQGSVFRTLALKRDGTQFEQFCRFLVDCPISYGVDGAALKQINAWSARSVQETLLQRLLQNQEIVSQYFIELEHLNSLETENLSLFSDFSLSPLILPASDEVAKSKTQPLVIIASEKTCEGTVAFTFADRPTSKFLFGQLLKNVLTNLENLAEITNVRIVDDHLVLIIKRPSTGQILMWCDEDAIKIKTQLFKSTQSPAEREICHEEMLSCSCPIIKAFFAEEMERCACSFGIPFEGRIEKAWCSASLLPGNRNEMVLTVGVVCRVLHGTNVILPQ